MKLRICLTASVLCSFLSCGAVGETFVSGDWTVEGGSFRVKYGARILAERTDFSYWTENYKKVLTTGRWTVAERTADRVTYVRESPEVKSVLTFAAEGKRLRQTLEIDLRTAPGPIEYAVVMRPERFAVAPGSSVIRLDGTYLQIDDGNFGNRGAKELVWETPEARYAVRSLTAGLPFRLQDIRDKSKCEIRYIHCSTVDVPSKLRFENEWTVEDGLPDATVAARRKMLARSPLTGGTPLAIENAGFEEGAKGWSLPGNAAIDDAVRRTGQRSVRLSVDVPERAKIYVTRLVPVTPGGQYAASCWARTDGVKTVEDVKGVAQDGVSLIVEWADKDGKWLQGGLASKCLWGTNDWTQLKIPRLTAPPLAHYAYVFLSVRAKGMAWFDDFSMQKLVYPVNKLEPSEGAQLATDTPHFVWKSVPGWRRYRLELSRSSEFPSGRTQTHEVGGIPEFRLERPLAPGTWYWRILTEGIEDDSMPGTFTVAVKGVADRLPPQPKTRAVRVLASDNPFEVEVRELTDETPVVAVRFGSLTVCGECVRREEKNRLVYRFAPPATGWPKGFSEGELAAGDKAGNHEERPFYLLNAPRPENAVVVDGRGHMRENGRRIFPIGIYEVKPEYMEDVRTTGFDAVHLYKWEDNHDDVGCRRYLDCCWAAKGLRAFIGFDRGNGTGDGLVQGNFAHVARRVGALADHPGLFCWYLFDEPELIEQFVAPDLMVAFADLVRALDPYHPVVMSTWNQTMIEYRRSWDTHWTQAYGNPATTLSRLEQERGFLNGESPMTLIMYCNDFKQSKALRKGVKPDPAKFSPDEDYLRACAFLGVVRECSGLWWWWFARNCGFYYTVGDNPEAWAGVKRILGEIKSLGPVINAEVEPASGIVTADKAKVAWWMKTVDGKTTFLAVNTSENPVTVEIDLPGFGKRTFTFRRYEVKNETLTAVRNITVVPEIELPVLQPARPVETTFVVDDSEAYNAWPAIRALKGGLLVVYSHTAGHVFSEGKIGCSYARLSHDGARTWSDPVTFAFDEPAPDTWGPCGAAAVKAGDALFWRRYWKGAERWQTLVRTDDGKRFEAVAKPKLDPMPVQVMDPVDVPGLGLVSLWFSGDYGRQDGHSWGLLVSTDAGRNWRQQVVESGLRKADWPTEPSLVWLGGRRLLALGRCEQRCEGNPVRRLFSLTSDDLGRTWKRQLTNIGDVLESTPSVLYDRTTDVLTLYYFQRGPGLLKMRTALAAEAFVTPTVWSEPRVVACGRLRRDWDSGNVNAVRQGGSDYLAYYAGNEKVSSVLVSVVGAGATSADSWEGRRVLLLGTWKPDEVRALARERRCEACVYATAAEARLDYPAEAFARVLLAPDAKDDAKAVQAAFPDARLSPR